MGEVKYLCRSIPFFGLGLCTQQLANAQPSLDLVTLCNKGTGTWKIELGRKTSPPSLQPFGASHPRPPARRLVL
jgi:hypothetical protein